MKHLKQYYLTIIVALLLSVGSALGVQYTVLYLDLAQTISAQHTFNPSTAITAPFIVGSNAAEVQVADLHAEVGTRFPANGANCSGSTYPAGIDATGAVETCTPATPTDTDYIPWPNDGRVTYCTCDGAAGLNCVGDTETLTGTCATTNAADDNEPVAVNCTTTTNNLVYGGAGTTINRADPYDITAQFMVGQTQITSTKRVWIGFTSESTANHANSATPTADFAAFRYDTALETTWQCVTGDGSSTTATDTGVTVDTDGHTFEIVINKNSGDVEFYIDNNLECTHDSADNLPGSAAHANMRWVVIGKNLTGGGTATGLRIGYVFAVVSE